MVELGSVRWVLVTTMALSMMASVFRLVSARGSDRRLDVAEVVMASGVIAMVVPTWNRLPARVWASLFAATAVWLLVGRLWDELRVRRFRHLRRRCHGWSHYTPQVMADLAMIYMLLPALGVGADLWPTSNPAFMMHASADGASMPSMDGASGMVAADEGIGHGIDAWLGLVPGALVAYFVADAVRALLHLLSWRSGGPGYRAGGSLPGLLTAPAFTAGRHVLMASAMAVMLTPMV